MNAVGFLQHMVTGVPEAYWENLESSVPAFLITPLSEVRTALHQWQL